MSFLKPAQPVYLIGPDHYLPKRLVTNDALVEWMGAGRASWIEKRTGISSRHWVDDSQSCSDLAVEAANNFFKSEKFDKSRLGQIILTTVSGDYPTPPTAPLVQNRLGLENVGAFDLGAACAGFVSGLHTAASMAIATHQDQLLISSEVRSKFLDKGDFATAVLFGDGASAAAVSLDSKNAKYELLASRLFSDGAVATVINIAAGGSRLPSSKNVDPSKNFLHMEDSASLFLKAAEGMSEAATRFLADLAIPIEKISFVVPHQANLLLIRDIGRRMKISEGKIFETIQQTGNTSGASVGIALSLLNKSGKLKKNDYILLLSAGGGGLAACALLKAC